MASLCTCDAGCERCERLITICCHLSKEYYHGLAEVPESVLEEAKEIYNKEKILC